MFKLLEKNYIRPGLKKYPNVYIFNVRCVDWYYYWNTGLKIDSYRHIHLCWLLLEFSHYLGLFCRFHLLKYTIDRIRQKIEKKMRKLNLHVCRASKPRIIVLSNGAAMPGLRLRKTYLIHCSHGFTCTFHPNRNRSIGIHSLKITIRNVLQRVRKIGCDKENYVKL